MDAENENREGIDLVAAYRALLRALAHLESQEYTSEDDQQAGVCNHNDLPDPASEPSTSQG
jgi:hypothetical protein